MSSVQCPRISLAQHAAKKCCNLFYVGFVTVRCIANLKLKTINKLKLVFFLGPAQVFFQSRFLSKFKLHLSTCIAMSVFGSALGALSRISQQHQFDRQGSGQLDSQGSGSDVGGDGASSSSAQTRTSDRLFSRGKNHSNLVKFGIQKAKLKEVAKFTKANMDEKTNLVRSVFGQWQQKSASAGICKSQNKLLFRNSAGEISCLDFTADARRSIGRQKAIGLWSHVSAQQNALLEWLTRSPARCAVATRLQTNTFLGVGLLQIFFEVCILKS